MEKKNGKGKEYDFNGKIEFEGEYKNGERNGKGKEYNKYGKLEFEGEYLNGKRNGKGKEYNKYGKLEFEGEYLNGEKNGKGKEYDSRGKIIFEGEYLNGEKKGVTETKRNYVKFESKLGTEKNIDLNKNVGAQKKFGPTGRVEEKIYIKKKKKVYLDNYQYHEIKDLGKEGLSTVVVHKRWGI